MESQPQNSEFRNNPENFHSCDFVVCKCQFHCYTIKLECVEFFKFYSYCRNIPASLFPDKKSIYCGKISRHIGQLYWPILRLHKDL